MAGSWSRRGLGLASVYLTVFFLAYLYVLWALVFNTANSELCGVLEILVTLPWSFPWIFLINKTGYVAWYSQFASQHVLYGTLATLVDLPPALLNAAILYFIGKKTEGKNR
jgi:hypothetical protein